MKPLVQQIFETHGAPANATLGSIVEVKIDRLYVQDGNAPTIASLLDQIDIHAAFDPKRVHFIVDHAVLAPDRKIATRVKDAERLARSLGTDLIRTGEGISHAIAAERGWYKPGDLVVGADSHTCTGGAYQTLALGMGATDIVAALVRGRTWLKVPQTVRLEIVGCPGPGTGAKDVMLHLLRTFGVRRFLYRSIEFCGAWIESLTEAAAATIANMSVELGAKCCFLSRWHGARAGMVRIVAKPWEGVELLRVNIDGLTAQITQAGSIDSADALGQGGHPVDYVFVGSCANGRLEDIALVASILRGRTVGPGVRLVVTPASKAVYLAALAQGHVATLMQSGALITPPGCGACVGAQGPIPADGDVVLSTMNRNFVGRMGNPTARIFLAGPAVAAVAAVLGCIPSANDMADVAGERYGTAG